MILNLLTLTFKVCHMRDLCGYLNGPNSEFSECLNTWGLILRMFTKPLSEIISCNTCEHSRLYHKDVLKLILTALYVEIGTTRAMGSGLLHPKGFNNEE